MTDEARRRRILFVCTANICRSPTAELLARARFGEGQMMFRSAGFLREGSGVPSELISVLADRHVDATAHRSYTLDTASVEAADLLLTMEASHVQQATMLLPEAFNKIVPLKEAAAIVERQPTPRISIEDFLEELNRDRDALAYLGTNWDVDDPYGKRTKAYQRAVAEIEQLVTATLGRLE
ncbi:MAG: hypothetical protein AAF531_20625 [Actinomycetota bacterium]